MRRNAPSYTGQRKIIIPETNIREANPTDQDAVVKVFERAFTPLRSIYRPTGEAAARQQERFHEGTRLVAETNAGIIGTVQIAVHSEHVHIIGLAVDPAYQRQGIARRLIEEVIRRTPGLDRRVVVLDTIRETGNVALFERLGFQVVRENIATWCESDEHDVVHDVLMERLVVC